MHHAVCVFSYKNASDLQTAHNSLHHLQVAQPDCIVPNLVIGQIFTVISDIETGEYLVEFSIVGRPVVF